MRTESAPLRRKAISVFDNKVERASRENEMFGLKSERTHNIGLCPQLGGGDRSTQAGLRFQTRV